MEIAIRELASEQDRARREREEAERRATVPLPTLLAEAISRDDERFGYEVLARAKSESLDALHETIALLFQSAASPALVAGALRMMLNDVTLSAAQWKIVAEGGSALGNNSTRNFALSRMKALAES